MDTGQLAAVAEPGRVERSFGFVDLCGFTDFVDRAGDKAALAEVQRLRHTVREVAPLFAVRTAKWLGDGVMIVGVDSAPLVAAVVAIEQRAQGAGALPLRAGVATGPVLVVEGDDYLGRAVNLAARLCDAAADSQILAAIEGLALPAWVEAIEPRSLELRGLAHPVDTVQLRPAANEPAVLREPARPLSALLDGITRPVRLLRGT